MRPPGWKVRTMTTSRVHDILKLDPGLPTCLLGNLAIVRGALEAGVQFFSCYPGTPSSEVGDTFARIGKDAKVLFEYSVNEKIALEIAFAACLTGARSMCGMKHLGLNYAGDPLSTLPYLGVKGGLVIVSAGDPSAITSPNEQDQRHFSRFLYYPMFDPATPADALSMTRFAFGLSEATRLPVILRPTTRVCHVSGMVEPGPLPRERRQIVFAKDPSQYVVIPTNARRMRKELTGRFALAESLLAESDFFPRVGTGKSGIVASGVAYTYVLQALQELGALHRVSLLKIGAYPVPQRILGEFLDTVDSVLVAEELTPFVEQEVALGVLRNGHAIAVLGKQSGHFPLEYEYHPDLVEDAIRDYLHLEKAIAVRPRPPELPPRPPVLCPGCPHRASFYLIRQVFGKRTVFTNDIGCYTLGYGAPLHSADVVLCMGASIAMASGIARLTGRRTVAYIGDSTFFHSGLPALVNAVQNNDEVTVCILNNYVTAMTGFQPSPSTAGISRDAEGSDHRTAPEGRALEQIVRGIGVKTVYSVDPYQVESTRKILKQAKAGSGVNVVICNSPCRVHQRRLDHHQAQPPFLIDQQKCDGCSLCVRLLGCPGLIVEDGRYDIDQALCDGCGLCADVCNRDAIDQVGKNVQS
jgi:indolepyruvate ferredoxin oxidoreductase alpha subunit